MRRKESLIPLVLCIVSLVVTSFNSIGVSAEPLSPYIKVNPENIVGAMTTGATFEVSIYTDYTGSDICSWQFSLTFNPAVLEGVSVENGDLITTTKHSSARYSTEGFNNTEGRLKLTMAYFYYSYPNAPYTTSGPGTLANATFRVKDYGVSNLTLSDTLPNEARLRGYDVVFDEPYDIVNAYDMSDNVGHGYFNNLADTDDDEKVCVTDMYDVGKAYGSTLGHPNWNSKCDFDKDSDVDAADLSYLRASYGKTG